MSVVVVSYNTLDKLRRCLSCIEPEHEVIVVDNASADGSAEMVRGEFPHARLIPNSENVGFGSANNQGMDAASAGLVLFLNSDCYAEAGAIARLAATFVGSVVAAGGKLLNPDGSLQESVASQLTLWAVFCEQTYLEKLFPGSKHFSPYWTTRRVAASGQVTPVVQVMGACLMIRPLERFDPRYFLYCEDTDLCQRLARHGKIVYSPRASFIHELGSSSGEMRWRAVALYNRGKEVYFEIHHGRLSMLLCWLLNRSGALLRLLAWGGAAAATLFLEPRLRRQALLFLRVLTAPLRGPAIPRRAATDPQAARPS